MRMLKVMIAAAMVIGCASAGSIRTKYDLIDYSHGIERKEAILIAKNHMLDSKYRQRYRITAPKVEDLVDRDAWLIRFYGKKTSISEFYMPSIYEVTVDKRTGVCRLEYTNNITDVK
jgi:hypothetical protein